MAAAVVSAVVPDIMTSINRTIGLLFALKQINPTDITRKQIIEIRNELGVLEYLITPKNGFQQEQQQSLNYELKCSSPGCTADWKTPDAGLLNFAPYSSALPFWLCRQHYLEPTTPGQSKPMSWTPPSSSGLIIEQGLKSPATSSPSATDKELPE